MLIVVPRNDEYAILRPPSRPRADPRCPRPVDRERLRCDAGRLDDLDAIKRAAALAWTKDVPTDLEIPISPQVPPLV
jgi:hypothetical protein